MYDPLILAMNVHDVAVVGHGLIQKREAGDRHMTPIGFSHVTNFALHDVRVTGDNSCDINVVINEASHGIVQGITITGAFQDVDGLAVINSTYVRVTGNSIHGTDIGITIQTFLHDATSWLNSTYHPTSHIEVDHNYVLTGTGSSPGFGITPFGDDPWVTCHDPATNLGKCPGLYAEIPVGFPDQRAITISDIYVHDNTLGGTSAVDCYCMAFPGDAKAYYPPVTRVRFEHNTYKGGFVPGPMTDSHFDLPISSGGANVMAFRNPGFELTGAAWWTTVGNAGATREATPPPTLKDGTGGKLGGLRPVAATGAVRAVSRAYVGRPGYRWHHHQRRILRRRACPWAGRAVRTQHVHGSDARAENIDGR